MRSLIVSLVTMALLASALPAPAQDAIAPNITEFHPNPESGQREYIELANPTTDTIDLAGWRIEDAAGNAYTFGDRILAPGAFIVLWTQAPDDNLGPAWGRNAIWNNGGDTAFLYAPDGSLMEQVGYGSSPDAVGPAPERGMSLALTREGWTKGEPSPGTGTDQSEGPVLVDVDALPPALDIEAPASARPGEIVAWAVTVSDPNADLSAWNVTDASGTIADGHLSGLHAYTAIAPDHGPWTLTAHAVDATGLQAMAAWTIPLVQAGVQVTAPAQGITFPPVAPGTNSLAATGALSINNPSAAPVNPRIDVSDLLGPEGHTLPVDGHLLLIVDGEIPVPYVGPLTPLPPIAPGGSMDVQMRLVELPVGLAAGSYGGTYAVVA